MSGSNQHVVETPTLLENVMAIFVCILTRKPLLIAGDPGLSKTLAISLVLDNMKGNFSSDPILQRYPRCKA